VHLVNNVPKTSKDRLIPVCEKVFLNSPVIFAYLYGSYATGMMHPFSDIDIAVYAAEKSFENPLDLELSLSIEIDRALKEKPKSDVRLINRLPLAVLGEIMKDGLLIYCRDDEFRIDYETTVRMGYFDFLLYLRKYQQTYLNRMPR